ncbi:MAG: Sip1-related alpha-galactosidase [Desulfurococcaceae archaeon]
MLKQCEMIPGLVKGIEVIYSDNSRETCSPMTSSSSEAIGEYKYMCGHSKITLLCRNNVLGINAESNIEFSNRFFAEIELDIPFENRLLVITNHPSFRAAYRGAWYYTSLAADMEPKTEKPTDTPTYPLEAVDLSPEDYVRSVPCWTYPFITSDKNKIPGYTVFVLGKTGDIYTALLALNNGDLTGFLGPGVKLRLFLGKSVNRVETSWVLSIGIDNDPYETVEKAVNQAFNEVQAKPRVFKKRPMFMEGLGWCSWNALLTHDLSEGNVLRIVKGLLEKGVKLKWVIIDDGWQNEVRKEGPWYARLLNDLEPDPAKFPSGFKQIVSELKRIGIEKVGLWHTINIHWSGFTEAVKDKIGVEGYYNKFFDSYVPPPWLEQAVEFYSRFYKWIREQGFDFVKVDNQWVINSLYWDTMSVGKASRNIQLALQVGASINGLEILNCMSMTPENYSNYFISNCMRVSEDYIPFWKADAKLHTLTCMYNSLFLNKIVYPDYDMWITYDPYARVHAVARIISGGPIYITDRHPEKTNTELLSKMILPNGEVVRVDEPALPTRDVLFRDPYNEEVLLKAASKSRHAYVVALFNVNKSGVMIRDRVTPDILPYQIPMGEYVYYKVFTREKGVVRTPFEIPVELGELDAEIVLLAPVFNGRSAVGIIEYLLPPYPIDVSYTGKGELIVETMVDGTLLYYSRGVFIEQRVERNDVLKI